MRQYAAQRLSTQDPLGQRETQNRHSNYYAHFLQQHTPTMLRGHQSKGEINLEIDNIRAAWQWAIPGMSAKLF